MKSLHVRVAALILLLSACAPLPDQGGRDLTAAGIRPGVTSAHDLEAVDPASDVLVRYHVLSPLRDMPSEMSVVLRRTAEGGYRRSRTVRIPESTTAKARLVANMVGQREGRSAQVVGTDVILRAEEETDRLGRTLVSDRGGMVLRFEPHDCRATPGTCRTVRHGPDGEEALVVTTSESGGIWREEVRRDDGQGTGPLVEESLYSLDEQGMLIDMNRLDHEKMFGSYQEIRRVE